MTRRLILLLLILLKAALLPARSLHAQEQAPLATDEDRAMIQAQRLRAEGDVLYQQRDFQGALSRYQQAHQVFRSPLLLVSIAAAYERLADPAGALRNLLRFFANPGDSVEVVVDSAHRSFMRIWESASPDLRELLAKEAALEFHRALWERFPHDIRTLMPKYATEQKAEPVRPAGGRAERVQKSAAAPPPARARGLTVAKWLIGGVGLLAAAAGGALLGLDGYCVDQFSIEGNTYCREALQGNAAGIALLVGGGAALGISGLLFGLDYRNDRAGNRAAGVIVSGRF